MDYNGRDSAQPLPSRPKRIGEIRNRAGVMEIGELEKCYITIGLDFIAMIIDPLRWIIRHVALAPVNKFHLQ